MWENFKALGLASNQKAEIEALPLALDGMDELRFNGVVSSSTSVSLFSDSTTTVKYMTEKTKPSWKFRVSVSRSLVRLKTWSNWRTRWVPAHMENEHRIFRFNGRVDELAKLGMKQSCQKFGWMDGLDEED